MTGVLRTLAPSDLEPSQIRQVTERVLDRPEFVAAGPGLLDRIWRTLLDWLARLLDVVGSGRRGDIVGTAILIAASLAVAFLTVRLVRGVRRDRGTGKRRRGRGGRSASDWLRLALELEARGDWAGALRCRYRALLAEFVDAGIVDEVAGRTARDYLREVTAAAPTTSAALAEVTEAFEATWYDRRPVTAGDVDAVATAADTVRRELAVR